MLAVTTSAGTWVAIATLAVLILPIYFMTLKAANSYGRLEQKVDQLGIAQAETARQNAETSRLAVLSISRLSEQFGAHALLDAQNFGEIRALLHIIPSQASPTVVQAPPATS